MPTPSPTPSPSYPFPDLTLPPTTILMDMLNKVNAATLPTPLTTDVCVFGDPAPYGATSANTQIPFGTTNPAVFGTGTVYVKYTRIDVSKVVAAAQPATVATMMSGALASINTEYGLHLQASDIIDSAITDGEGTLNIAPNSMIYTGNIALKFSSSTPTPTPAPTPAPTPPPVPTVSFDWLPDDGNPLEVHFTDTSDDQGGTIVGWSWDFGDGVGTSNDQNPTYTYASANNYDVTLSIFDAGDNEYDGDAVTVTVVAPDSDAPSPTPTPSPGPTPD